MYRESDHEYCKLHNLLFDSWEDYGIHRVNSDGHLTCEHCYKDFGSKNGLDLHLKQVRLLLLFSDDAIDGELSASYTEVSSLPSALIATKNSRAAWRDYRCILRAISARVA